MGAELKKVFGSGAAKVDRFSKDNLYDLLESIITDLQDIKAKFDAHKHQLDGSALAATSDITGGPVTGAATGAPDGGTATSVAIGTTKE